MEDVETALAGGNCPYAPQLVAMAKWRAGAAADAVTYLNGEIQKRPPGSFEQLMLYFLLGKVYAQSGQFGDAADIFRVAQHNLAENFKDLQIQNEAIGYDLCHCHID